MAARHKSPRSELKFDPRPRALALAVAGALVAAHQGALALPTGGEVAAGQATISRPSAGSMQIDQSSAKAILNWQSFSIGAAEAVNFSQPSASAIALNRVLGSNPSEILGRLSANGQVFLVNPNGVLFGRGASVDVGGLVATTLSISDQDFLNGDYVFANAGGAGAVRNEGTIVTANGYTALMGPQVSNDGLIAARLGSVALAAADRVSLDMVGDGLITVSVDQAAMNASAINSGRIEADGGHVLLTARSANALLDTVVNNSGVIRATSLVERNGEIVLDGGSAGVTSVSGGGSLEAVGAEEGRTGGTVKVLGQYVGLFDDASIDAAGDAGGGTVLVGGNFLGQGPERNSRATFMGADAVIRADAVASGNGGRVAVWSDGFASVHGTITARGSQAGTGGAIETSGKQILDASGVRGDAGKGGSWLFDPDSNVTITTGTSDNGSMPVGGVETWTPTADSSTIDADSIRAQLDAGTDVRVTTTNAAGTQAGDIIVDAAITRTAAGGVVELTLDAGTGGGAGSVILNASISAADSTNALNVTLRANNGAGGVQINAGGDIVSRGGDVNIIGQAGGVSSAAGTVINTSADADSGLQSGAVSITAAGNIALAGDVVSAGADSGATSGAAAGNAGPVNIVANDGSISVAGIDATGGSHTGAGAGDDGGDGAAISLTTTGSGRTILISGTLDTSGGTADGAGAAGQGAIITATATGDLTLDTSGSIITTNAGASSVILIAGDGNAAGTASGGNVILNTGGTITSPGQVLLYTGSIAGSTGVTDFVGTGSGNFRYNSAFSDHNFTLALGGTAKAAIYREQPTVTITADDQGPFTYGDAPPAYTFVVSGLQNGDTEAQAFSSGPTVADDAVVSGSGNLTAGGHTLTPSAIDQLGYAIAPVAGTLTIDPRPLTVTAIAAASSTYGSPLAPGAATFDANLIAGDTVTATVEVDIGTLSSSGNPIAGTYTQTASAIGGADAGNYSFTPFTTASENYTINQLTLTGAAIAPSSSTYGSALNPGVVTFGNVVPGDTVTSTASVNTTTLSPGGNPIVGTYTQTAGPIAGADAANYSFGGFTSAANYTIDPLAVTLTAPAVTKTYDGGLAYLPSAGDLAALSSSLLTGDTVTAATISYTDKNVGAGNKAVNLNAVTINDGNGGANYTVTLAGNNASTITRLGSVQWVGAATGGSWATASNWAGNAIPDLANVANVDLNGANVIFDGSVSTGTVDLDSLANGALTFSGGTLNVSGSTNLSGYSQTGGTLNSGTLGISGATDQTAPGAVNVTGPSSLVLAGAGGITMTGTNNFGGLVTLGTTAGSVVISDSGAIAIGNSTIGGNLTVNAGGQITLNSITTTGAQQYNNNVIFNSAYNTNGGAFTVTGTTTVASDSSITTGAGNVTLGGAVFGPGALTINSAGATTFGSTIGSGTPLASITTDAAGTTSLAGNVTTTGSITFKDPTTANGLAFTSLGAGTVQVFNANSASPGTISTGGNVIFGGGTPIGTQATPLVFAAVPAGLQLLAATDMFFSASAIPTTLVFPSNSSVTGVINGVPTLLAANASQLAALGAASSAQTTAASATVQEANETFGTDSVAEQVEYGFAGDVGTTPPMDHRLEDTGISVPRCLNEAREGVPCS